MLMSQEILPQQILQQLKNEDLVKVFPLTHQKLTLLSYLTILILFKNPYSLIILVKDP